MAEDNPSQNEPSDRNSEGDDRLKKDKTRRWRHARRDRPSDTVGLDTDAAAAEVAKVPPAVVSRWLQLVLVAIGLLFLWVVINKAGPVVILFLIGALIALILNPFVSLLQRVHVPRSISVFLVYLALILVVVGIGVLVANPIAQQVSTFQHELPKILTQANAKLLQLQTWLNKNHIGIHVTHQGRTAVQTLGDQLAKGSRTLLSFTSDALRVIVEAGFALILILVISIYMLLYGERIGAMARRLLPPGSGTAADDFPSRVQRAVVGYCLGQLLFSFIMGFSGGLMLWVLGSLGIFPEGKSYALFFGAFYGLAELIPYVGPTIGAAPPIIFALFGHSPFDAVWLALAFILLQQVEGHIVAPNVFGQVLRINPLLVIFALLFGGRVYGLIGAFLALPIAAILRECVIYFNRHVVLEPWGTPSAAELVGAGVGLKRPVPAGMTEERKCPVCGAGVKPGESKCTMCGTELPK